MVSNPYESQGVQGYDDSLDKIAALQAQLDQARMQRQAEIAGNKDLGFSDRERALQALDSGYAVASGNLNTQRIGLDSQRRIASDVAFTERMRQRDLQSQQAEAAGRQQAMALNTGMGLSEDGQRSIGLSPRGQTQQAAPGKGSAPDDADFNAFQRDLHALVGAGREEAAKRLFASRPGYWERLGVPPQIYTPQDDGPGLRAGNREHDMSVNMDDLAPVLDSRVQEMDRRETLGLTGGRGASGKRFTTTVVKGPDGRNMIATVDTSTGQIIQSDLEIGIKPTGSATKNTLVKIGQKSGIIYPDNYDGASVDGEIIVTMPADQATKLAISKGNNTSREKIAEMAGDYGLLRQDSANIGRRDAIDAKAGWDLALNDQRGQSAIDVQKLRNEGAAAVAQTRGAGGVGSGKKSVYQEKYDGWLAAHPNDPQGALDFAGGRRQASQMEKQKAAAAIAKAEFAGSFNVSPEQVKSRVVEILQSWEPRQPQVQPQAAAPTVGLVPPRPEGVQSGQTKPEAGNAGEVFGPAEDMKAAAPTAGLVLPRPEGSQAAQTQPYAGSAQEGYASAEDVKAAYRAGNITLDQAKAALKKFGYQ